MTDGTDVPSLPVSRPCFVFHVFHPRFAAMTIATFPAVVKILPQHIFNKKDPIVFGVEVLEGTLKVA